MRHFEAFLDSKGEYIAGKSTIMLRNLVEGYSVGFILGILNSRLVKFFMKECYGGLAMDGGITFTTTNIGEIPIAKASNKVQEQVSEIVDKIVALKKNEPYSECGEFEVRLDKIIYDLYGLTSAEIEIIESKT